jgi:hypothetical protein
MPPLKGLIRGDTPLARAIFDDGGKRRLIPQLQTEGWPIFEVAGKRAGYAAELRKHADRVQRRLKAVAPASKPKHQGRRATSTTINTTTDVAGRKGAVG